jgi:hypothetical protein
MTMPGDLLSGALIEVARDLREKRVTARELIEAAIARHERFGEHLPGMEERFQRALRKALNTPPKHRAAPASKPKERPASKGRVHKGKTRNHKKKNNDRP